MKIENSLTEISKLVERYKNEYLTLDGHGLIEIQVLLSTHSFYLAELTAKNMADENSFYWNRKVETNNRTLKHIRNGSAVNRADKEALEDPYVQQLNKHEREKEAQANRCKLILQQVNRILSALQQHISFKRKEEENAKT